MIDKAHSGDAPALTEYDAQVWQKLNEHWERRARRREIPAWASSALERSGAAAREVAARAGAAVPDVVRIPVQNASEAVVDRAARPAIAAAVSLLELVNDWAAQLQDPANVMRIAQKQGLDIADFRELRHQDLKTCDRLLSHNTLTWRTMGALEGGAMGALALVPVAGIPLSLTVDVLVVQVLSVSIASRVAYAYGFDAKDPAEADFVQDLVRQSFMAQALKAEPLRETAQAAQAIKGRVRWSAKLREDHRLIAQVEKLLQKLGPSGTRVPVQNVGKVLPFIGIAIGAGVNAAVLGKVASDAQKYCQTRTLCERYGLPYPAWMRSAAAMPGVHVDLGVPAPTSGNTRPTGEERG